MQDSTYINDKYRNQVRKQPRGERRYAGWGIEWPRVGSAAETHPGVRPTVSRLRQRRRPSQHMRFASLVSLCRGPLPKVTGVGEPARYKPQVPHQARSPTPCPGWQKPGADLLLGDQSGFSQPGVSACTVLEPTSTEIVGTAGARSSPAAPASGGSAIAKLAYPGLQFGRLGVEQPGVERDCSLRSSTLRLAERGTW